MKCKGGGRQEIRPRSPSQFVQTCRKRTLTHVPCLTTWNAHLSKSFRPPSCYLPATSQNFNLLPIEKLERRPRYISRDVAVSIRRFEVCRLHERVDVNNFKNTFLFGHANAVASLRNRPSIFGYHLVSPFVDSFMTCTLRELLHHYLWGFMGPREPSLSPPTRKASYQFASGVRRR